VNSFRTPTRRWQWSTSRPIVCLRCRRLVSTCQRISLEKIGVGVEWRFLSLTRLLPSVRGLAAAGPSGGDTAADVACTRAARSGPAGCPRGDWRLHGEPYGLDVLVRLQAAAPTGCHRLPASGASLAGAPGVAAPRALGRRRPWPPGAG